MNRKPPLIMTSSGQVQAAWIGGKTADMIMLDEPAKFEFKLALEHMTLQMAYDMGPSLYGSPRLTPSLGKYEVTGQFADTPALVKPRCMAVFGYTQKYECQLRKGHDPSEGYKQYGHWSDQLGPPKPPKPPKDREMG